MLARSAVRTAPPLARASSTSINHHARQFQPRAVPLRQVADEGGATTRQIQKAVEQTKSWYAAKSFEDVPRRGQTQVASTPRGGGAPAGGLGSRLAKRRGEKGGVFDADAKEVRLSPSAAAAAAAPELSPEDQSWVRRTPLPKRANAYTPSSDRPSSSSRPTTNASSTSSRPPRTPSKFGGPKSSSSSPRSPRTSSRPSTSTTPLRAPSKFTLSGPLDLAALIQEDLRSRALKLGRSVEDIEAGSKAQQEARLAAHRELMGDYSRFWPSQDELVGVKGKGKGKGREVMSRARKVLAANSSVGLEQREVILGAVEKAMR